MKKISLKSVKETLSRKEMRVIAGGYGVGCPANSCSSGGRCAFWIGSGLSSGCDCFIHNQNVGKHNC